MDLEKCVIGIEFGSTRIKAVLIDENHAPAASGSFTWENRLEDGIWTYHMEDALEGLRVCFRDLKEDVKKRYGVTVTKAAAIGISGMMHGYLVFDKDGRQLVPFRTWRNTITQEASEKLSELFHFHIPQRWCAAHLYQAVLNGEAHVPEIADIFTLSSYIHYRLTGRKVIGVGEASGMFPYDDEKKDFDTDRAAAFDELIAPYGFPWTFRDVFPEVLPAGAFAGALTEEGASLLDPEGDLLPGIPMCPPEGDAGTGMVATGAVLPRTGNISAGTSSFSMQVLERPLKGYYEEIDVVATPSGSPVAMAHCNNCTPEIDAWAKLFADFSARMGNPLDMAEVYPMLYRAALEGEADADGMAAFNFLAGEPLAGADTGRPLFVRLPESRMTLPNFMRAQLYGAIAALKIGIGFLKEKEQVETDRMLGHGGFFKTPGVGTQIMADALGMPIMAMETAGEGGPWGMALLAAYMVRKADGETLEQYLAERVFKDAAVSVSEPDPAGQEGFRKYFARYKAALAAEKAAAEME